jgi:formamidopyrimidine-DNA glycosylase
MPELPDLAILADGLHAALVGRPIEAVATPRATVVRGTPAETEALAGQRLAGLSRRGKFLDFHLTSDRIVVNPMLTGRLGLAIPGTRRWTDAAFVVRFGPRQAPLGKARSSLAGWTKGAAWLPPDETPIELRYRDPTRMGKVYLLPAGLPREVPGWAEQGPDADDPALDLEVWRSRIRRLRGELKNVLREQSFVAGIGNGYADEILGSARLAPFRKRTSLNGEEIDALHGAVREVLPWAIGELRQRVPPRFEVEVRDFLRVHRKGGQACPRCGGRLSEIAPGGFVTTYCRSCQR